MIRRVFIRARQQFGLQPKNIDLSNFDMHMIEVKISEKVFMKILSFSFSVNVI